MKICIVYDTKRGSTTYFANWMKESFKELGMSVDVKRIHEVEGFDYDLFIIGSPIYWEKPLKSVVDFLFFNKDILRDKKIAFFVVCMAQLFGKHTENYIKYHYLMPLEKRISGAPIGSKAFKGWLKKPNYKEREEVIKWVRELT